MRYPPKEIALRVWLWLGRRRREGARYWLMKGLVRARDLFLPCVPLMLRLPDAGRLVYLSRDHVAEYLFLGGRYEVEERKFVADYLNEGMVFFDIGANLGIYTLIGARRVGHNGQVHSFEPAPSEFRRLMTNVRVNRLENVVCNQLAVAERCGRRDFYVCGGHWGSFSGFGLPAVRARVRKIDVQSTTLDEYVAQQALSRLDLVKVDVEGAELFVLEGGASRVWLRFRPIVLCELNDKRTRPLGLRAAGATEFLRRFGYAWFEFDRQSGGLRAAAARSEYSYDNLVAVPEERTGTIAPFVFRL